jgi:Xaa-Pro aminopeptidase
MEGRLGGVFDSEVNTATRDGLIDAGMRYKGERGHGLGISCFAFHEGTYISRS